MKITRNPTRPVSIGNIIVGDGHPIAVQSMTATKTQNIDATVAQAEAYREAGAGVVRIAVDSDKDAVALGEIRKQTTANLAVDLQENFKLAELVAPHVDKIQIQPRTPLPSPTRQDLAGKSPVHYPASGRARLCDPHRCKLRQR